MYESYTVFKVREKGEKRGGLKVYTAFLIFLKDALTSQLLVTIRIELEYMSDIAFIAIIKGDSLAASDMEQETEGYMANFLRGPIPLTNETVHEFSRKRKGRLSFPISDGTLRERIGSLTYVELTYCARDFAISR